MEPRILDAQVRFRSTHRNQALADAIHAFHHDVEAGFIGGEHFVSISGQGLTFHEAVDGKKVCADRTAIGDARLGHAHATPHADRLFIFNQSGHLILGRPTPKGFENLGDTLLVEPTLGFHAQGPVVWTHPAYANGSVYARSDRELVCASLAVGTMIGTIRRIDTKTGEPPPLPRRRGRQRNHSSSIGWSSDGRLLAVAGGTEFCQSSNNHQTSGYVRLWNAADHTERSELAGLSNNVMSVAFSPDNRLIATAGIYDAPRIRELE